MAVPVRCVCASMKPGINVLCPRSMTVVLIPIDLEIWSFDPTATILPSLAATPSVLVSSTSIVITFAFNRTISASSGFFKEAAVGRLRGNLCFNVQALFQFVLLKGEQVASQYAALVFASGVEAQGSA